MGTSEGDSFIQLRLLGKHMRMYVRAGGRRPRAHNTGTSVNKRAEPSKDKLIRTPQQTHTQKTHNYTRGYAQSPPSNTHAPSCFLPFPTHTHRHTLAKHKERDHVLTHPKTQESQRRCFMIVCYLPAHNFPPNLCFVPPLFCDLSPSRTLLPSERTQQKRRA